MLRFILWRLRTVPRSTGQRDTGKEQQAQVSSVPCKHKRKSVMNSLAGIKDQLLFCQFAKLDCLQILYKICRKQRTKRKEEK